MTCNRIQFQKGLSEANFAALYGTEDLLFSPPNISRSSSVTRSVENRERGTP